MQTVKISDDKKRYILSCDNYTQSFVTFCRSLQGAKFNLKTKIWTADRSYINASTLRQYGVLDDVEILSLLQTSENQVSNGGNYVWKFLKKPFEYQEEKTNKLQAFPNMLLRGDPGVGKTCMGILWLAKRGIPPSDVLIVCPPTLIPNWEAELLQFVGEKSLPIVGTPKQREAALAKVGIHITNYDYLVKNGELRPEFAKLNKTALILDESHKCKNPTTQRSKVLHNFSPKFKNVLLMTGTPLSQGAQDYYSQMKIIDPKLLGATYSSFKSKFCIVEQIRGAPTGITKIIAYQNLDELNRIVAPFIVDVTKEECLDLPPKTYETRYVDLSPQQSKDYRKIKHEMALWVQGRSADVTPVTATNILTRMIRLSQITQGFIKESDEDGAKTHFYDDNPKLKALLECVNEELAPNQSVIVICRFKNDIEILKTAFGKEKITYDVIDGSVPSELRLNIANRFQNKDFKVLVGQIQTVGVGLNLDTADTVIFYSNSFSLVDRLQAEDRIHRATTKHPKCTYIDIVAQGTIDDEIIDAIRSKKDISEKLTQLRLDF